MAQYWKKIKCHIGNISVITKVVLKVTLFCKESTKSILTATMS